MRDHLASSAKRERIRFRGSALTIAVCALGAATFLGGGTATASSGPTGDAAIQVRSDAASPVEHGALTWYPWGSYATQEQCVAEGNRLLREQAYEFRAYHCQYQSPVWKLYMDEYD